MISSRAKTSRPTESGAHDLPALQGGPTSGEPMLLLFQGLLAAIEHWLLPMWSGWPRGCSTVISAGSLSFCVHACSVSPAAMGLETRVLHQQKTPGGCCMLPWSGRGQRPFSVTPEFWTLSLSSWLWSKSPTVFRVWRCRPPSVVWIPVWSEIPTDSLAQFLPTAQGDSVIFCRILAGGRQIRRPEKGAVPLCVSPIVKPAGQGQSQGWGSGRLQAGRCTSISPKSTMEGQAGLCPEPAVWSQFSEGPLSLTPFIYKMV